MSNQSGFEFTNLKQFQNQLKTFLNHHNHDVREKLKMTAVAIENEARREAPKRSGVLKAGYHTNFENINNYEVSVETNVEYAPYVELGTQKMEAQPHLEPALINNRQKFFKNLETSIKRSWEKL